VDTVRDPYSAIKGFFYAHIGWMLIKQDKENIGRADITGALLSRACGPHWHWRNLLLTYPRCWDAADVAVAHLAPFQLNACPLHPSPAPVLALCAISLSQT
jgi:hypothetical protein